MLLVKKNTKIKKAKCGKGLKCMSRVFCFFIRSATECISNLKILNTGRKTQKERSFTVLWGVLEALQEKIKKNNNSSVLRFGSILNEFSWPFWAQFSLSERAVREQEMKWVIPLYLSSPGALRLRYTRGRCAFHSLKASPAPSVLFFRQTLEKTVWSDDKWCILSGRVKMKLH